MRRQATENLQGYAASVGGIGHFANDISPTAEPDTLPRESGQFIVTSDKGLRVECTTVPQLVDMISVHLRKFPGAKFSILLTDNDGEIP